MTRLLRYSVALGLCALAPAALAGEWSYDGDRTGQDNWGELSPAYAACTIGTKQSPIQIADTTTEALPPLTINYATGTIKLSHTLHGLFLLPDAKPTLSENGHSYMLQRVELHSPSEHTVRDRFYPMELEFIHSDAAGKILALSVFVDVGDENAALGTIGKHIPATNTPPADFAFNLNTLLPKNQGYYAYTGSLTSPPCTEGVEWRLLKTPLRMSKPQFSMLANAIGRNARLPQPVYLRVVKESRD